MKWLTILLALHAGPVLLCWSWSPVTHKRLLARNNNNNNNINDNIEFKGTALFSSSSGNEDSAMSAYDQAMKAMTAPKIPTVAASSSRSNGEVPTTTAAATATVGTGVKDLILTKFPIAPAFAAPASPSETETNQLPVPPVIPAAPPASFTNSADTNGDAGMSVYDQYMKQQQQQQQAMSSSNQPAAPDTELPVEPNFVEATFHDPVASTKERSDLADATTWAGDAGIPPEDSSSTAGNTNQQMPYSPPPTQPSEPVSPPPSTTSRRGNSAYDTFMKFNAVNTAPSSASSDEFATLPEEEAQPSQFYNEQTAAEPLGSTMEEPIQSYEPPPTESQNWEAPLPPLSEEPTNVPPQKQSLLPPVPRVEPTPMVQEASYAPPEEFQTPPQPVTRSPIIPPPEVNMNDDPITRMAAAAKSGAPPSPLEPNSFMNNAWGDEGQNIKPTLLDPINFFKSVFGKQEPSSSTTRSFQEKAPDTMVKTGVSKRILERMDTDQK